MISIIFAGIFFLAAAVLLVFGSLAPSRPLRGFWAGTDIPVSRVGHAAWAVAIASFGVASLLANVNVFYGVLAFMSSFALLVVAGLYDSRAYRKRRNKKAGKEDADPSRYYAYLKTLPCRERPKFIAIQPWGWTYLRDWRSGRWLLAMLAPPLVGAIVGAVRGLPWGLVAILAVFALVLTERLFVFLAVGMLSTNTGTYFRDREPLRFWANIALWMTPYVALTLIGLFAQETGKRQHPKLDFDKWARIFPIESFTKTSGRRYIGIDDRVDLWKPRGQIITSPAHVCEVELVRKQYAEKHDLGKPVPVDIFLWSTAPPPKPYLTKLGGTPYREAAKPWPKNSAGKPYTFVAQFCFVDSRDIVSDSLPGDVMLVFFEAQHSYLGATEKIHIEWSDLELENPVSKDEHPPAGFAVPELSGVIYRCNDYPESDAIFERQGHSQSYLFASSQSTKIGRETFYIQGDPRDEGQELICALSSLQPAKKWPYTDVEDFAQLGEKPKNRDWSKHKIMFGDVGCIYLLIDAKGKVTWAWDCY
jgi:uncharacterized protein YwqG